MQSGVACQSRCFFMLWSMTLCFIHIVCNTQNDVVLYVFITWAVGDYLWQIFFHIDFDFSVKNVISDVLCYEKCPRSRREVDIVRYSINEVI